MAEWPENQLYAQWSESAADVRAPVEAKLYAAVKRHVQKVLWNELKEDPPHELVDKATAGVMTQLKHFRKACEFSTWVHEIAARSAKQYIRGKVRERKVFDEYTAVVDSDSDDALDSRVGEITPSVSAQAEGEIVLKQWRENLPTEDAILLESKEKGLKAKEIAEKMGTTVHAVRSRWARLKPRIKKNRARRRK